MPVRCISQRPRCQEQRIIGREQRPASWSGRPRCKRTRRFTPAVRSRTSPSIKCPAIYDAWVIMSLKRVCNSAWRAVTLGRLIIVNLKQRPVRARRNTKPRSFLMILSCSCQRCLPFNTRMVSVTELFANANILYTFWHYRVFCHCTDIAQLIHSPLPDNSRGSLW